MTTPTFVLENLKTRALSLADYVSIIGYDECAFNGVYYDGQIEYDCKMFWTEQQRLDIYRALNEAQYLMEEVMGYPLSPTWITGQPEDWGDQHYVDVQSFSNPVMLRYGNLIKPGIRATSTIQAGALVNYGVEPATVGPIATTVTNVGEVKVYYPGTTREITPSRISYSGGNLTLYIPRCRLVETPNLIDAGMDFNVIDNFLSTVDVVRIYNDSSTAAVLVRPHTCSAECSSAGCSEYTQTACMYARDMRLGLIDVVPATYTDGTWLTATNCVYPYEIVRLNYYAGLIVPDYLIKDALVRLAHSRMANEPCGCTVVQALWERDRKAPDVLSRERLNCPFGVSEGAWTAYKVAQLRKHRRMSIL